MPRVWVSVGSNVERERHVRAALAELRAAFGRLRVSPIYRTRAVGFDGEDFFNLVVGFDTGRSPRELHSLLRDIEARHGRARDDERFAARTLDLDLLTYGHAVTDEGGRALPRDEVLRYAFVLAPLADVAGAERHPVLGTSYAELWADFPRDGRAQLQRLDDPSWLGEWRRAG